MNLQILFKRAMKSIGDKALHYNVENKGEVDEYLQLLSRRTTSPKRATLYLTLAEAIKKIDVAEVERICGELNVCMSKPSPLGNAIKLNYRK